MRFSLVFFQNDSYIHEYISFYFVAPVAVMGGIALDRLIELFPKAAVTRKFAIAGELSALLLLVMFGTLGATQSESTSMPIPHLGLQNSRACESHSGIGRRDPGEFSTGSTRSLQFPARIWAAVGLLRTTGYSQQPV
jgi:hypothetical protein